LTLNRVLGYTLARALEEIKRLQLPAPGIVYTLAQSRREDVTREGLTPRVIGVKENTLIVSCFRDGTPKKKED